MIKRLLNKLGFLFEILLLAGFIVLIYIWNPMGIFSGKLHLQPTANLMHQVSSIGELVTAEYYGEVIASIDEARLNFLEEEEISNQAGATYSEIMAALNTLRDFEDQPLEFREAAYREGQGIARWRRIIRQPVRAGTLHDKMEYLGLNDELLILPFYDEIVTFLYGRANKVDQPHRLNLSANQKNETLWKMYQQPGLNLWNQEQFTAFFYQRKMAFVPKNESRKKLAMVGRGTVKAGFDLSRLDKSTFYINEEAGELHFFGISPKILNADINPWFIPEKGIPGFEILDYNGRVDFRDSKKVKEYAIDKLRINAEKAEILKNAEISGAETFKNLFSLITGKPITKVLFHDDNLRQLTQNMMEDGFISYPEAVHFETLVQKEYRVIDSLRVERTNSYNNRQLALKKKEILKEIAQKMCALPFEDMPGTFSYFSKTLYEISLDSIIDKDERERLTQWRQQLKRGGIHQNADNTIWWDDSLQLFQEFNLTIGYLLEKQVEEGNPETELIPKNRIDNEYLATNRVKSMLDLGDTVRIEKWQITDTGFLLNQLFPFQYTNTVWNEAVSNKNLKRKTASVDTIQNISMDEGFPWLFDKGLSPSLYQLDVKMDSLLNPYILEEANKQPMIWFVSKEKALLFQPVRPMDTENISPCLTDEQSQELEAYLTLLSQANQAAVQQNPIKRANDWWSGKWKSKSTVLDKFSWVIRPNGK